MTCLYGSHLFFFTWSAKLSWWKFHNPAKWCPYKFVPSFTGAWQCSLPSNAPHDSCQTSTSPSPPIKPQPFSFSAGVFAFTLRKLGHDSFSSLPISIYKLPNSHKSLPILFPVNKWDVPLSVEDQINHYCPLLYPTLPLQNFAPLVIWYLPYLCYFHYIHRLFTFKIFLSIQTYTLSFRIMPTKLNFHE